MNWNTGVWNNANGDGAIFDGTGAGAINVTSPINVDSLNLIADGYSFNGTGPLIFVNGTSTLDTGVIIVDTDFNFTINTPVNSSVGLCKLAPGTLVLAGPITFSGLGLRHLATTFIPVDIYAAGLAARPSVSWRHPGHHEYWRPSDYDAPGCFQWSRRSGRKHLRSALSPFTTTWTSRL